jgi:GT2 family glycosyltransferase
MNSPLHDRPALEAVAPPLVSILVVNYNGARFLPEFFASLQQLTYPRYEVVLVDNASSDESLSIIARHPWVKLVRSEKNLGFAGGNNLGLQHCSGELICLLNNDMVAHPRFLEPLCDYLQHHSEVGVVQGKMVLPRFGGVLDVCGSFLTSWGLPYHYGCFKPDSELYQRSFPVLCGKGACLLFPRKLINQIGGFLFEESFFCYYEETDFCHRVWLSGSEVHFVSGPANQHYYGGTAGPQSGFALGLYLPNMTFSLLGNLGTAAKWRIIPRFLMVLFAGMLVSLLKLKLPQAGAYFKAFATPFTQARRIKERQALVKRIRKRSDQEILAKTLRDPGVVYFLKTLSGQLGTYKDQPIQVI